MITSESNKAGPYTCDGVTTEFPFSFPIFAKTDIRVFLLDIDNKETELDYITDFIVTAENDDFTTGGTVTTLAVYDDSTLTILRDVDITQESDYVENETFPADTFERDRDKLVMMVQQLVELTSRMLRTAITDEAVSLELPRVADRISRFLAFDATGKPIAAKTITGVPVTGFMESLLDDETAEAGRETLEVYSQSEVKQLRYLRHKGRYQNYAGNNGTGQGAEIFNKTTDVSATWDQYAHGKGDYAFKGGVYDGKYVWMFPAYSDDLIRINPATGTFESFAHGKGDYAYYGGCFDGTYIWMAPFNGDSVTRVDPEDGSMTHYAHSYGTAAFAGAVFDGRYVWLIPEESNTLVRLDPEDGSMSDPTGVAISTVYAAIAFNGGCFDGEYIWMCPFDAGYLVKLNPVTNILTNYYVSGRYEGIVFDGTYLWLFPATARYILKINKETGSKSYIPTGEVSGYSFSYGCFDGISLWLAPNDCSTIFKLNPKDNSIVKFSHGLGATGAFAGAIFDGESVWMVPFQSDDIVRIRPPEFGKQSILLIPVGAVIQYGGAVAPLGYLFCDGSAVNRTTYANLFSVISTTFGAGNGSTTFNLPDFRGIFPRGAGTNGTLGSGGGSVGDYQAHAFQGHKHRQGGWIGNSGGDHVSIPWGSYAPSSYPSNEPSSNAAENNEVLPYTSPASYSDGTNGTPKTASETRPANLSINFIIKI